MKLKAMLILILTTVVALAATSAISATIDVSPPKNITNTGDASGNGYYERDPELLVASDGTWYLVYARSQTQFTAGGVPDNLLYDIYYKTSTDNGATWSDAVKVLDAAAIRPDANFRSVAVCEANGKIWVIGANAGANPGVLGVGDIYANTYSGGSWSGQSMIFDGNWTTGAFHVDAVAEENDIRLFYGIQNETEGVGFIMYHGDTDIWDTSVTKIGAAAGWQIPRVIKEGSKYYLVSTNWENIRFTSTTTPDVVPWPTATNIASAPSGGASSDPCILKYGESGGADELIVFHAPSYSDESQPQEYVYSTDGGSSWSSSVPFTETLHGTQKSWDMMPRAYMKDANTIMSFFSMEKRGVNHGQGDIVLVTWDISATIGNAHYTTVQDGVDNAGVGDEVSVAAGTYTEQVEIAKDMTLMGAGLGTVIVSPDALVKYFTTVAQNRPILYIHDANNVVVEDLVVDGAGKGNLNHRFIGIAYRNAGGRVEGCTIKNIVDTPASSYESVSLYAYNDDGLGRSLMVRENTMLVFRRTPWL